jgi:hypothetical protein
MLRWLENGFLSFEEVRGGSCCVTDSDTAVDRCWGDGVEMAPDQVHGDGVEWSDLFMQLSTTSKLITALWLQRLQHKQDALVV